MEARGRPGDTQRVVVSRSDSQPSSQASRAPSGGAAIVLCARYVSGRLRCRGLVKSLVVRGRAAQLLRLAMEQVDKLRFGQRQ